MNTADALAVLKSTAGHLALIATEREIITPGVSDVVTVQLAIRAGIEAAAELIPIVGEAFAVVAAAADAAGVAWYDLGPAD